MSQPAGQLWGPAGGATTHVGGLPSGSRYLVEVPQRWNGVLLLVSHPVPVCADEPPLAPDGALVRFLVEHGYGVAASANTIFWPLERVFTDQPALLDVAAGLLGPPRHTIALGLSIGGIISAGAVQRRLERLSGALALCGNLAGAVANQNRELDVAFVVKTLLAADTELQVTGITNSCTNLELARKVLHEAQASAPGRARLALAAAVGNIPGWYHPDAARPAASDAAAQQRGQFDWFDQVGFLVYFLARKQVEMQAGGNPSWNTGVDYRDLLSTSSTRRAVEALYEAAGVDLDGDLEVLAAAPRIAADPSAVSYLERHIVFDGDLGGTPVLTMHTEGDGLVTPDHEHAYADVVAHAGNADLLRQLFVHRGGHCTFTFAELAVALDALIARIEGGTWPDLAPGSLNDAAWSMGSAANVLSSGTPGPPAFAPFDPSPFRRRYDARDAFTRNTPVTLDLRSANGGAPAAELSTH